MSAVCFEIFCLSEIHIETVSFFFLTILLFYFMNLCLNWSTGDSGKKNVFCTWPIYTKWMFIEIIDIFFPNWSKICCVALSLLSKFELWKKKKTKISVKILNFVFFLLGHNSSPSTWPSISKRVYNSVLVDIDENGFINIGITISSIILKMLFWWRYFNHQQPFDNRHLGDMKCQRFFFVIV